ncbi:MAG: DUF4224 domain-containing protein [Porticoccaceae bacterium]|nr:DUF4224 domain-containing protein [Porticoccaceae bacterium]
MSEILTGEELAALTGSSHKGKQMEVLRANRIPYFVDIRGRPVVIWSAVRRAVESETSNDSPRFEVLEYAAAAAQR